MCSTKDNCKSKRPHRYIAHHMLKQSRKTVGLLKVIEKQPNNCHDHIIQLQSQQFASVASCFYALSIDDLSFN
ncbi:hypothetical protein D917_05822 [Trichinella nativa]|uniref:Uncharacterized protein n=1 Tax=Trichinella nativa TaxID=6335 RepID=A0A1Y3EUX7_9BILA|nr:hypothetical protein D917_05822 [Trichinella nativa]